MKEAREQHPGLRVSRRERMQEPEAVAQMLALARLGWGTKRIARELGVLPNSAVPLHAVLPAGCNFVVRSRLWAAANTYAAIWI